MSISRADTDRLLRDQSMVAAMAAEDLRELVSGFNPSSAEEMRDFLLEIVPGLSREYGEIAATSAAEWYEELRGREVGGSYTGRAGAPTSDEAVEGSVRYSSRNLFGETASTPVVVEELSSSLRRHVSYAGRETVARNVRLDPRKPRFARVPSMGENGCSWCALMGSRGFVYHSAASAGEIDSYHDNCQCQIVPQWDSEASHIAGYDPDDLYEKYEAARESLGGGQAKAVAAEMRRLFPERFDH